ADRAVWPGPKRGRRTERDHEQARDLEPKDAAARRWRRGQRLGLRLDRSHEAISDTRPRLDEVRATGRVAQRDAYLADTEVDPTLEVDVGAVGPQLPAQLRARDHFTRARREQRQRAERLSLQRH